MKLFKDLGKLFFPDRCLHCKSICNNAPLFICNSCFISIEETNFTNYKDNSLEKIFWGKSNISRATSLYYYHKDTPIQTLLKNLKYNDYQEIGEKTGDVLGKLMLQQHIYQKIDYVIPVPLHPKKERLRGYNQVDLFGRSIAKNLGAIYIKDFLIRTSFTNTQTKKNKLERIQNVANAFKCNNKYAFENKNILLVDDVITTGATIEVCSNEILKHHASNIFVASIACVL